MISIKTSINNIEYNTETDELLIKFMTGTLFKKETQYYLYCKQIILNDCVMTGLPLFTSDYPSHVEKTESLIPNYDEETRLRICGLGNAPFIKKEVTESITLIPTEGLVSLFISEIQKSKVEIANVIILSDENPILKFEGSTYHVNIHGCTFIHMEGDEIPEHDEYYIKVGKNDQVMKKQTDNRGYPASCGIEHKNKNVTIIVRGDND